MGIKQGKQLHPKTIKDLQGQVDFSQEEIKTWYKEYKQSLPDGEKELTKNQFKSVYNSLFIGDASDFAEQVFRTFDKDGNGTVDFQEFLIGLCVSGSDNFELKLKWAFDMYDMDNDNFITKEEMEHIIKAIFKMTNTVETDPVTLAEELFQKLDLNRDDRISWEEFKAGAEKDSLIVDLIQCDPGV